MIGFGTMAFRKRRFFRKRVNGKLSRKHYTWVTALNTHCTCVNLNTCAPEPEQNFCCPSEIQFVLLDNAVIQSSFQDAIKVVRIHGSVSFQWNIDAVIGAILSLEPTCEEFADQATQYVYSFCGKAVSGVGIREISHADLGTLPKMNPMEDFDFSEGRWKQMRFHQQMPTVDVSSFFSCPTSTTNFGVCSDTIGTSPGATSTVCSALALPPSVQSGSTGLTQRGALHPWTWSFNNKLNLRVRENQLPVWSIGWGNQDGPLFPGGLPPAGLRMNGALKLLIEVG